jgi:hypothetical protein
LGLERIVAKRKDAPYRSGPRSGWIEVKTAEWRAANRYRAKLFEKPQARVGTHLVVPAINLTVY